MKFINKNMKIVRLIPIVIFALAIIISSCEKEKVIQDDIFNSLKNNDLHNYAKTKVYFIRGHKYVEINGKWEHWGYYMREYRTSGLQAFLFGPDCYGYRGNCLPEIEISGVNHNGDAPNFDPENISYLELNKEEILPIVNNYKIPLENALNNGQEAIIDFFKNNISVECDNIPTAMNQDFLTGKLTIKFFSEGYFIVNKNAQRYDDCPVYNW
ncbi:MAG: hypothetical protein RR356_00910 [Bacteroidales bacterium]